MENSVATYLKYANLQMAAESLFGVEPTDPIGTTRDANSMTAAELVTGNKRSSRFSTVPAQQLIDDGWTVVEHKSNTTTGFSGTLFKNTSTGELVLSFRSTEFADDAARDNQQTNKQEIKPHGWAFGQIDDMQTWYQSLQGRGLITQPVTVTGYSLGGHLATAFNLLHQGDLAPTGAPLIAATYTFNGAGVGDVTSGSLTQVMNDFHSLRNGDAWTLFQTQTGLDLYQQLASTLNGTPSTADLAQAFVTVTNAANGVTPTTANQPLRDDLAMLQSAIKHASDLRTEIDRVNAVIPDSSEGGAAKPVDAANVAGIKLDYQLAVLGAARSTASYRTDPIGSGVDAYYGRNVKTRLPNFYDIYGDTSPSAVSNSQWHYGAATPVFIEDQPLVRGNVVDLSLAQTLMYQDIKLLNPNFSQNDFGDTHSLVLLVDSLNIQNTLATLDPNVSQATLNTILQSASSARKQDGGSIAGQGKAEGDVLENVLNSLSKMLQGSGATTTVAKMDGGTWADIADRNIFYTNLQSLTLSDVFKAMAGKVSVVATAGDSTLPERAKTDFAALLSLLTLSPVQIKVTTDAAAIEAKLNVVWSSAYAQWDADKSLTAAQRNAGQANYTDTYLNDRQTLLQWQMVRNLTNATTGDPLIDRASSEIVNYDDNATNSHIQLRPAGSAPAGTYPTRYVTFGRDTADTLAGASRDDRLYGGAGADALNGQGGNDYLEGNADNDQLNGGDGADTLLGGSGADALEGGLGNDSLLGGSGSDTYTFNPSWGSDTVLDGDGSGAIVVTGLGAITGAGTNKIADNTWQSANKQVNYTLVAIDANRNDLYITFSDRPDVIRVQNWSPDKSVGITLPGTITPPAINNPLIGDYKKKTNPEGTQYLRGSDGNYVNDGAEPGAQDVITGSAGADSIQGLGGNDILAGGDGADLIEGGDGDDALLGGLGRDTLMGGAGRDIIIGSARGNPVYPAGPDTPPIAAQGVEWSRGFSWVVDFLNPSLFYLRGASALSADGDEGNVIDAGAGDDFVIAGVGADVVHGGEGDDWLGGLDGSDLLFGDAGDDFLNGDNYANATNDYYVAPQDHGNDTLVGGAGQDSMIGYGGSDDLFGGSGDDTLVGDDQLESSPLVAIHGNDYLDGGDGNDDMEGCGRDDELWGGAGNDTLRGDASVLAVAGQYHGNDYLDGEDGADALFGGGAADTLYGGAGDDQLFGDDGAISGPGSPGYLQAQFQGGDYLDGEDGNDSLVGEGGADTLFGGTGNDTVYGDDDVSFLPAGDHGNDYLDGEEGNDWLVGDGGNDTVMGGAGNDFLSGDDQLSADALTVISGDDYLDGESGDDDLLGGNGNDTLLGGDGADLLVGGAGNDLLIGGLGIDTLRGGKGDDVYEITLEDMRVSSGGFVDVIDDTEGTNTLRLGGSLDSVIVAKADSAEDMSLILDAQHALIVQGATGSAMSIEFADGGNSITMDRLVGERFHEQVTRVVSVAGSAHGGALDDVLSVGPTATQATLSGGRGDDQLTLGSAHGGTVLFSAGDGSDVLRTNFDLGTTRDAENVLKLGAGLHLGDLHVVNMGGGQFRLQVGSNGTDGIAFAADPLQLSGSSRPFDRIVFADGSTASWADVVGTGIRDLSIGASLNGTDGNDTLIGGNHEDRLHGLGGDDVLYGGDAYDVLDGGAGNDLLIGGDGDDSLLGGDNGNDTLVGGRGNDELIFGTTGAAGVTEGGTGDDRIYAFGSNKTVKFGLGDGQDKIFGWSRYGAGGTLLFGDGVTSVHFRVSPGALMSSGGDMLNIDIDGTTDSVGIDGFFAVDGILDEYNPLQRVTFANGASIDEHDILRILYGTTSGLFDGGPGRDARVGSWGNDTLRGNAGNDLLWGAEGNDRIEGGTGNDDLRGGLGADVLDGGDGHDAIAGGDGSDYLIGGDGQDTLSGGRGDDTLDGGAGGGELSGGEGNDVFRWARGSGAQRISNADTAWESSTDTIEVQAGILPTDVSISRSTAGGNDLVLALAGTSDSLLIWNYFALGGRSADAIDKIQFADGTVWRYADVKAALPGPTAGDDLIWGFEDSETISGGAGNDTIYGVNGSDVLSGDDGNDQLNGGTSASLLLGGAGDDWLMAGANSTMVGGQGVDAYGAYWSPVKNSTIRFARGDGHDFIGGIDGVTIELAPGILPSDLRLTPYENYDQYNPYRALRLSIAGSTDWMDINDFFTSALRSPDSNLVRVVFADGTVWDQSFMLARAYEGTPGDDYINGTFYGETISGGDGNDVIYGNEGNDTLRGGTGNDNLTGGPGNDVLDGGAGSDYLTGGDGDDIFMWGTGSGLDQITAMSTSDQGQTQGYDQLFVSAPSTEVWVMHSGGNSLTLGMKTTDDRIELVDELVPAGGPGRFGPTVESVLFSDGVRWDFDELVRQWYLGSPGADMILGADTDDLMRGQAGNDILSGGGGADTLQGGVGDDSLSGGLGNDTYIVARGDGFDSIYAAAGDGQDTFQFAAGIAPTDVAVVRSGDAAFIAVAGGGGAIYRIDSYYARD